MKAILCNDCGAIMSRYNNVCKSCSRTNLSYFPDTKSPELHARLREIRAETTDNWRRLLGAGLIAGVFFVFAMGYVSGIKKSHMADTPVQQQTAAGESAVVR